MSESGLPEGLDGPLAAPSYLQDEIASGLPELEEVFRAVITALSEVTPYMFGFDTDPALRGVLHQANNSFIDALYDLRCGRGRTALAGMRSLFDLLVTAHDVAASPELADRYEAHAAVIAQLEGALMIESRHLPKTERSADLHHRKKLVRDSTADYKAALELYGKRFRRSWSEEDLKTRAERYGLGEDYDTFRLASGVLHGSSGGAIGLRAAIGTESVVRTGPALSVCPLAYLQVFRFYDGILKVATPMLSDTVVKPLRDEVGKAVKLWPKYRRALLRVDRRLWPAEPPPPMIPILAFRDGGNHREWHLLDGERDQIIEANAPKMDEKTKSNLEGLMKHVSLTADPRELLTIAVMNVRVVPKADAEWRDPLTVLPRRPAHPMRKRIRLPVEKSEADAPARAAMKERGV